MGWTGVIRSLSCCWPQQQQQEQRRQRRQSVRADRTPTFRARSTSFSRPVVASVDVGERPAAPVSCSSTKLQSDAIAVHVLSSQPVSFPLNFFIFLCALLSGFPLSEEISFYTHVLTASLISFPLQI